MNSTEIKQTKNSYTFGFVTVTVTDTNGNRIEFEADGFTYERTTHRTEVGNIVSTECAVSFERIKSHPVTISTAESPVDLPAPKYVPAMGDAAYEYCQDLLNKGVYYENFRWHEVWRRMWAAREK